jgi:LEA14-like dessication related protein
MKGRRLYAQGKGIMAPPPGTFIRAQAGSANMTLKALNLSWGEATSAKTKIYVDASIYNPNNYPITIKEVNYTMEMNGIRMGEGVAYNQTVIEAKTDRNVSFTAIVNNTMLSDWWAAGLLFCETTK